MMYVILQDPYLIIKHQIYVRELVLLGCYGVRIYFYYCVNGELVCLFCDVVECIFHDVRRELVCSAVLLDILSFIVFHMSHELGCSENCSVSECILHYCVLRQHSCSAMWDTLLFCSLNSCTRVALAVAGYVTHHCVYFLVLLETIKFVT